MEKCIVCGRMTNTKHHLIFGNGRRELCDLDSKAGLVVPMCDGCHTMNPHRLHDNPIAETLSKALGQALWELQWMDDEAECREAFIKRYGRNYIEWM